MNIHKTDNSKDKEIGTRYIPNQMCTKILTLLELETNVFSNVLKVYYRLNSGIADQDA